MKFNKSWNTFDLERSLARWEGAVANTYPQHLEITDTLIQSLIDLAHSLRRLGVRDIDGKLTYEEGELC